jgi:4-carboxymuconolactone decarboxylase
VLDAKTTQLVLFAMMMATGGGAARHHAVAALRAGATLSELAKVVELASAMASLGPVNTGSALLAELASFDTPSAPDG